MHLTIDNATDDQNIPRFVQDDGPGVMAAASIVSSAGCRCLSAGSSLWIIPWVWPCSDGIFLMKSRDSSDLPMKPSTTLQRAGSHWPLRETEREKKPLVNWKDSHLGPCPHLLLLWCITMQTNGCLQLLCCCRATRRSRPRKKRRKNGIRLLTFFSGLLFFFVSEKNFLFCLCCRWKLLTKKKNLPSRICRHGNKR